MRFHIITYGCQMNEADSRLMAGLLEQAGWRQAESLHDADLVVVNTCSVRDKPERKVWGLLGQLRLLKERRPSAVVVVAGCMAQRVGEELAAKAAHVDAVLGTRSFHRIVEAAALARAGERPIVLTDLADDPARDRCQVAAVGAAPLCAYVPIILGCTNFCSYCIVPHVRGPEASRPADRIMEEVRVLAARGAREVTLLGQNVLAYGRDLGEATGFAELLAMLANIEGLWRLRFLTCHPRDVTPALARCMAEQANVCEHIHLPVQAGSDRLLREMNRGYTAAHYRATVAMLREHVPGLAITTDIMVGFPGETDKEFEESLRFYEEIGFDGAFTFAFSARPGTAAAVRADQVPGEVKIARLQRLIALQNRITVARNQAEVGRRVEVLVEGRAERGEGLLSGRTRHHKQVVFPGPAELIGSLVEVRLTTAHLWGFTAEAVAAPAGAHAR